MQRDVGPNLKDTTVVDTDKVPTQMVTAQNPPFVVSHFYSCQHAVDVT